MEECRLWEMPTYLLLRPAVFANGPVRCSSNRHSENLLSKVWRYILPNVKVPWQYPFTCILLASIMFFFKLKFPVYVKQVLSSMCWLVESITTWRRSTAVSQSMVLDVGQPHLVIFLMSFDFQFAYCTSLNEFCGHDTSLFLYVDVVIWFFSLS